MNDVNFEYVVLRNWDRLPFDVVLGEHSDLDLLTYDFDHFTELFPQAHREYSFPRVRMKIPIDDSYIYVDIRSIGDNYYPEDFQRAILATKEWNARGFYMPNPYHHRLALAYHAVHHKNSISKDYARFLGTSTIEDLLSALKQSSIGWIAPMDTTVGSYNGYWSGATSIISRQDDRIIKSQHSYKKYDLLSNEYRILSRLDSDHFPKIYSLVNNILEMEYCGIELLGKIPFNWIIQLRNILSELNANGIIHRDIRLDNLMVKDEVVKLIDFGWAKFVDEENAIVPPSCLGFPNKPSYGFDDNYSMNCVIRQIQYVLEEKESNLCV